MIRSYFLAPVMTRAAALWIACSLRSNQYSVAVALPSSQSPAASGSSNSSSGSISMLTAMWAAATAAVLPRGRLIAYVVYCCSVSTVLLVYRRVAAVSLTFIRNSFSTVMGKGNHAKRYVKMEFSEVSVSKLFALIIICRTVNRR